jgi:disulfide bond formation protein DsbB
MAKKKPCPRCIMWRIVLVFMLVVIVFAVKGMSGFLGS